MATAYTSLLGLALPVTGELSGSWGDTVNDGITSLLDSAISGTTSLTTDADVILTTTTGAANEARQAIILWNPASGTVTRNVTAPAQSKIYTVINASGGTQSIVFRGVGPTTGVTVVKGESAVVAWNGTDFIKIGNIGGGGVFTTLSVSGDLTLSGGTANGVSFLNGSKVLTTGSALTFDGTGFGVITSAPTFTIFETASGNNNRLIISQPGDVTTYNSTFSSGSAAHAWQTGNTEQMRLTSTGLGIGTSSPSNKLVVSNSGAAGLEISPVLRDGSTVGASLLSYNRSGAAFVPMQFSGSDFRFATSDTEQMRLTSTGLGIGTSSPSAKLTVNDANSIPIRIGDISAAPVSQTAVYVGASTSGLPGAGNGDLVLIPRSSDSRSILFYTGNGTSAERARIDSSGNFVIGTLNTGAKTTISAGATQNGLNIIVPTVDYFGVVVHNQATSGDNVFMAFGTEASFTTRGSITYNRGAGLTVYGTTSDYRAKDIIGPVADSGALIDAVPVYMGKMKGATQERPMFIAHETPAYAHTGEKDAVDADGKPVYQQMDASALIPVMWAEIQSLRARLAAANI